jgi:hypothetical protein
LRTEVAALDALRTEAAALDALIASAVEPAPPSGALERLLSRVPAAGMPPPSPIPLPVPLPARRLPPLTSAPAWMALAASLLLGFWAGSAGLVDGVLLDPAPESDWSAIDLSLRDDGDGA